MRAKFLIASLLLLPTFALGQETLKTRWTAQVNASNVHPEYPRPQMVRPDWVNLNGSWDFALLSDGAKPTNAQFTKKILVPFPVESYLSGVQRPVRPEDTIWYRRTFTRPAGERVLLHFGAVDCHATVWVNGKWIGEHKGGFDPFSFDITDALNTRGQQTLMVSVKDPTDAGTQPRGKQVLNPRGIFYTPSSGIWQTVWLEPVPRRHIRDLDIKGGMDGLVQVDIELSSAGPETGYWAAIYDGDREVARASGGSKLMLRVRNPKLWSPDSPYLYRVKAGIEGGDAVGSYVALRQVSLSSEAQPRIQLNGKPLFLFGPLDQGFWPDGLFTAPTEGAMKYDLEVTKRLGFNMIRKHVKVEPARWYYWCDKMGLAVLQDMPSGDRYIGPSDPDITRTKESAQIFEHELAELVEDFGDFPCVVTWVLFNEGWGQYDTARMTNWLKKADPSRLVISASGWTDRGTGDISDAHVYPGPGAPAPDAKRAIILGEFGGLGLPMSGHTWKSEGWGYQSFQNLGQLKLAYSELLQNLKFLAAETGLSAAVYTQTTDVETEVNGIMTYDRARIKLNDPVVWSTPEVAMAPILSTSQENAQLWRYSFGRPREGWETASFDDSMWLLGPGGFGRAGTPGATVRTLWDGSDIWIRQRFTVVSDHAGDHYLKIHHDDDVSVYLDGRLIYQRPGWTVRYKYVKLPSKLTQGEHTLAIHCHQNRGGQYIDAGFVAVQEK